MATARTVVHVGILVFPNCVRSAAVVPHDVLATANLLASSRPAKERVRFVPHWVSPRKANSVRAEALSFDVEPIQNLQLDALLVPGLEHSGESDLTSLLDDLEPEQTLLRAITGKKIPVLFGCSAACLLARAGVLDGRRITTSWWLGPYFRKYFPGVSLHAQNMLLQDDTLVSAAGITSYFDLALWIVGHFAGDDSRQMVGRLLVHDYQRENQLPYAAGALNDGTGSAIFERAQRWLNRHLLEGWTVSALARHCHTSERTLLRRFKEVTGTSPLQYARHMRVERAKKLLESTVLSLPRIAEKCGYQDASTLQKVFKQKTQLTPREYRKRFGIRR